MELFCTRRRLKGARARDLMRKAFKEAAYLKWNTGKGRSLRNPGLFSQLVLATRNTCGACSMLC